MRFFKIFTLATSLVVVGLISAAFIKATEEKIIRVNNPNKGFAVIELFTSEGCSSCPPADALVARIQKESADKDIYILSFHVDYWNRLGWKDVFSSPEYSERQNKYAHWLNLSTVYTPQIVVNGRTEFVGSEEGNLRNAIKSGLQNPSKSELSLIPSEINNDKLAIKYHADGKMDNSVLLVAVLEKNASVKVQRGENGGRTLSHVQIVRQLTSISLENKNSGVQNIALPHGFNTQDYEVIGFIQNLSNGEITGAGKAYNN